MSMASIPCTRPKAAALLEVLHAGSPEEACLGLCSSYWSPQHLQSLCKAPHPGVLLCNGLQAVGAAAEMVVPCGFMTEGRAFWIRFWGLGCLKSTKIHLNRQLCLNLIFQFLGPFLPSKWKSLPVQFSIDIYMSQFCRELRVIPTSWRKCKQVKQPRLIP